MRETDPNSSWTCQYGQCSCFLVLLVKGWKCQSPNIKKIKENAFVYITGKEGKKGKEIEYSCLEMDEYLLISKYQNQEMFSI